MNSSKGYTCTNGTRSFSLFLAPKYWDTIIPAPTEIPTNNTSKRFNMGPALPTAASALSPIYYQQ